MKEGIWRQLRGRMDNGEKGLWMGRNIGKEEDRLSWMKWNNLLENLAIVVLAFYPLRHIQIGLDLWDTGYNYANFQYMGTRHMDSMWLFSTYLTNVVGNMLTKLPNGDTLMGMNLYTGLFVSMLALMGYFFCSRKLKMPKAIAFAGEMTALSLCWCPSASFYNYLTYLFFMISCILLYQGLTIEECSRKKKGYLVSAGLFLGANVLVRFSNLPQMGMILAVWAYDFLVYLSEKKAGRNRKSPDGFWKRTTRHTLWCLLGYVAALAAFLSDIHLRYGIGEYVAGIRRLFAMTDNATDYKPAAMIMGIIGRYKEEMYWVVRIGAIAAGGMALFAAAGWLEGVLCRYLQGKASGQDKAAGQDRQPYPVRVIRVAVRVLWIAVSIGMIGWLYARGFFSFLYYSYDSIWHPGPLFLMLAMFIAAVRILDGNALKEEKLISGMVILIILLTSVGSNNDIRPSLNNLFLAAPYTLWESWRFLRYAGERRTKRGWVISGFPVKGVLAAFLALCLFQFVAFGAVFAFAEGTGIQNAEATVDNNAVLRNIKMNPQKAEWMTQLSAYANENGLRGQEVILYGWIPALSYYLQMPSAFNPWSDLDSYSRETMERDMAQLEGEILEKGKDKPVIILENNFALYEEGGEGAIAGLDLPEKKRKELCSGPKWKLLLEFMEDFDYEQTFRNEKFAVYR